MRNVFAISILFSRASRKALCCRISSDMSDKNLCAYSLESCKKETQRSCCLLRPARNAETWRPSKGLHPLDRCRPSKYDSIDNSLMRELNKFKFLSQDKNIGCNVVERE